MFLFWELGTVASNISLYLLLLQAVQLFLHFSYLFLQLLYFHLVILLLPPRTFIDLFLERVIPVLSGCVNKRSHIVWLYYIDCGDFLRWYLWLWHYNILNKPPYCVWANVSMTNSPVSRITQQYWYTFSPVPILFKLSWYSAPIFLICTVALFLPRPFFELYWYISSPAPFFWILMIHFSTHAYMSKQRSERLFLNID